MGNKFNMVTMVMLLFTLDAMALQERVLDNTRRAKVNISANNFNRVSVIDDRIENVFGMSNQFYIETDEKQGQIFIGVKDKSLESISLTLVTENGETQDLLMNIKDIPAETILFKVKHNNKAEALGERVFTKVEEGKYLLNSMIRNDVNPNYMLIDDVKAISEFSSYSKRFLDAKLKKQKSFISRDKTGFYQGDIYRLENRGNELLKLKEQDFYWSNKIKLISVKNRLLSSGQSTLIYVVREVK